MNTNPNDAAFSRPYSRDEFSGDRPESHYPFDGLTKREYFAAMAMQALITRNGLDNKLQCAVESVAFSDALIATLNK